MEYLLLCVSAAGSTFQNFMSKQFNAKGKAINPYFYATISAFMAMMFFVITSGGKFDFTVGILPYSIIFGVVYGITSFSTVKAMKYGPMSITSLMVSMSMVVPTLFGIIVLNDPIGMFTYIGLGLLILAIVLINIKKETGMKFSLKWVVFAALTFFGNGFLGTLQKVQQLTFNGAYKSEFMIIALMIVWVSLLIIGAVQQGDKKLMFTECVKYAGPAGLANGMVNLLGLVLMGMLPTAVLFPLRSSIDMVLTFVIAMLVFKEKPSVTQALGYTAGVVSVILLNL